MVIISLYSISGILSFGGGASSSVRLMPSTSSSAPIELSGEVRPFSQLSTVLMLTPSAAASSRCFQRLRSRARLILVPMSVAMP